MQIFRDLFANAEAQAMTDLVDFKTLLVLGPEVGLKQIISVLWANTNALIFHFDNQVHVADISLMRLD